jgi:hypothetical protein
VNGEQQVVGRGRGAACCVPTNIGLALGKRFGKKGGNGKEHRQECLCYLVGFAEGLQIDAELLALFVEMAAFEAEGAGDVGHVKIVAFDFGEENFFFEGFGAFGEGAGRKGS